MSDTELNDLATVEGRTVNRPSKPLVEMTDEELQTWVQSQRDCLTQHQSLMAEMRAGGGKAAKEDTSAKDMEMFE